MFSRDSISKPQFFGFLEFSSSSILGFDKPIYPSIERVVIMFLEDSRRLPTIVQGITVKLIPGHNLAWVKPLSLYGFALSGEKNKTSLFS